MYQTYILENPKGKLYIGYTKDLNYRVTQHNIGAAKYTKSKGPWQIVYQKSFATKQEASEFERYLKSLKSPEYIRKNFINI
jgi:putative endonuclease